MAIFCIEEFKAEYDKLNKNNSYSTLEKDLIDYFFDKPIEQLLSGSRLNGSNENPYIKKRLKGSGGYRFYFLVIVKDNNLYLLFVHPKTGSLGFDNVTDESKAYLYKTVLDAIKNKKYYRLEVVDEKISFIKHTIVSVKA
jgi:hypothetical protein